MDSIKQKILVVDDEDAVRNICRQILERHNYLVDEAENGLIALDRLKKQSYDLILTDLNMPKMDGLDLLKNIKAKDIQIPVIMMTGFATVESAVDAMKTGSYDYITKPVNIDEMILSIKKCLEHRQLDLESTCFRQIITMHEMIDTLVHLKTENEILQIMLEKILKSVGAKSGSIFIIDEEKKELNLCASVGLDKNIQKTISIGEGIAGRVVEEGRPIIINDGFDDHPEFKDFPVRSEIASSVCLPMIFKSRVIGVICLNRLNDNSLNFSQIELKILEIFASQAASITTGVRSYQKLIELDKLKSEFISNVSHELRTPLTVISGAIEMIDDVTPTQKNTLKNIAEKNIEQMKELIYDLLDFGKMGSGKIEYNFVESSISEIANGIVIEFKEQFNKKNIDFEVNILPAPPIKIDPERIKQVISNLLSNTIKFTRAGGKVKINVEDKERDVVISVSDTGIGISSDQQKKIFDKFYQVDGSLTREQGGFGLGLAIVKSIVEAHKGKIWVESEINKGSTFYISIPKER